MSDKIISSNGRGSQELAYHGKEGSSSKVGLNVHWTPAAKARLRILHRKILVEFSDPIKPVLLGDVFSWHSWWLSSFAPWAGEIRVSLVRGIGDKRKVIERLRELEDDFISPLTQVNDSVLERPEQVLERMAALYCEFVSVSPFEAGNEEMAELLILLVSVRSNWMKEVDLTRLLVMPEYRSALKRAYDGRDYKPMIQAMSCCLSEVD